MAFYVLFESKVQTVAAVPANLIHTWMTKLEKLFSKNLSTFNSKAQLIIFTGYQRPFGAPFTDDEDTNEAEYADGEDADADRWVFAGRGCFGRVVLDETQKAKAVRSLITQQILSLKTLLRILLSATFIINKASDLYDLLWILWNEDAAAGLNEGIDLGRYDEAKEALLGKELTADVIKK